jgi:SAM-dependent methyltransferase
MKLLEAGYAVTSLDASGAFVERLRRRLHESRQDADAPALVGDICEMPFADSRFDGVVCGEVLEHLDNDLAAVREIARVLCPDGILVASVPANPWSYDWVDHWAGHRRRYTAEGLGELMAAAGLDGVEVIAWGFPLTGLYHRIVYRRVLRRRLERAATGASRERAGPPKLLQQVARSAFEVDSLFLGRRPGYFGFLAVARRAG